MPVVFHDATGTCKIKQLLPQSVGLFFFCQYVSGRKCSYTHRTYFYYYFPILFYMNLKKINNFIAEEDIK